jgi:hypothetical protein
MCRWKLNCKFKKRVIEGITETRYDRQRPMLYSRAAGPVLLQRTGLSPRAPSRRWFPRTVVRRVLRPADQHFNFNGSTPSQRSIIPSARADGLPPWWMTFRRVLACLVMPERAGFVCRTLCRRDRAHLPRETKSHHRTGRLITVPCNKQYPSEKGLITSYSRRRYSSEEEPEI